MNEPITKQDIKKVRYRWLLLGEAAWNYEKMQGLGYCFSMIPVLKKLYPEQEDMKKALNTHLQFFNTHQEFAEIILGIDIAMEEKEGIEALEAVSAIKTGLMGPLAGIGDRVDQGVVATIPLAIFVPMALEGSVIAAFIPGLIYIAWSFGWSWFLFNKGYSLGKNSVLEILHSGAIKKVIDIASIVGLFMIGCLSASYIKVQTIVEFASDTSTVKLQEIIDGILPNMLPFIVVMGMYLYITKRGPKYIRLMIYTMIIAIVLTFFHII